MKKTIIYVDMDNVLVDFKSGIEQLSEETKKEYEGHLDDVPDIFSLMKPMPGAIEAYTKLNSLFDVYILSTAPWDNPSAWKDKVLWVQKYMGELAYKRLILSHYKNLCVGDYLIDDRLANGADKFSGEHIHFGTDNFPDWDSVLNYLIP